VKAPKLLPWIAHKNGITDQLALNLWRRACGESEEMCGCCNSSDYYGLVVSRFIELADWEGEKCAQRDPRDCPGIPDVGGLVRDQNRFWQLNQLAIQKASGFWRSTLKYFSPARNLFLNN
jgi:hypothetical protein